MKGLVYPQFQASIRVLEMNPPWTTGDYCSGIYCTVQYNLKTITLTKSSWKASKVWFTNPFILSFLLQFKTLQKGRKSAYFLISVCTVYMVCFLTINTGFFLALGTHKSRISKLCLRQGLGDLGKAGSYVSNVFSMSSNKQLLSHTGPHHTSQLRGEQAFALGLLK
jgi:hypothetical protein